MTFIHLRLCFSMSAHTTIYCFFSFSKQHHFFMAIWTMRIGFSLNILFSFTFWILTNQHLSIFSFNFNHKFVSCWTFFCCLIIVFLFLFAFFILSFYFFISTVYMSFCFLYMHCNFLV